MSTQDVPDDWDDFDEYLAGAMADPAFRRAYERAEWVSARWWRRVASRWAPSLLRALRIAGGRADHDRLPGCGGRHAGRNRRDSPGGWRVRDRLYRWRHRAICAGWRGRGPCRPPARALWIGRHMVPLPTWFGTMDL